VKVNLFGFQISELAKFLMIIFFAKYFAANHDYFREIPNNTYLFRNYFSKMLVMFLVLIAFYLVGIGDQGPAVVLCVTFLIFYSFSKNEFFKMVIAALIYALTLFALAKLTDNNTLIISIYAFTTLVGISVYAYRVRKNESTACRPQQYVRQHLGQSPAWRRPGGSGSLGNQFRRVFRAGSG